MAAEFLKSRAFIAELHRLLWIEPFRNRGIFDPGWSCRDHAVLVGCTLRANGIYAVLSHGKNMFVQGASDGWAPMGIGQPAAHSNDSHTWLKTQSGMLLDPSPRLSATGVPGWRSVECLGIIESRWLPEGTGEVVSCGSGSEYDQAIALASHRTGANTALYWEENDEELTADLVTDSLERINSPLTAELRRLGDVEIYCKAALHLAEIAAGKGRPLAGLSHQKAWSIIASSPAGATNRLIKLLGW